MAVGPQGCHTLFLGLLLCALSPTVSHAGKVLLVPVDGSHWLSTRGVIQQLQQRGHEIMVLAPEASVHIKEGASYTLQRYPVPFGREDLVASFVDLGHNVFENKPFLQRVIKIYKRVQKNSALLLSGCSYLLHNKELMASLAESRFDIMLTDPFLPCGPILAQYLALPTVFFLNSLPCSLDFQATQCPNPTSYVPRHFSFYSDHMTFLQRVKNMLFTLMENFLCSVVYSPYALLASEFLQRDVTVQDLFSSASVWLLRNDFVNDYPRPIMPNM
ncbi:UDP-glucuronosyltransferase 1-1, partial [Otolemur garnettii]